MIKTLDFLIMPLMFTVHVLGAVDVVSGLTIPILVTWADVTAQYSCYHEVS